ncbi:MAG: hypothetical protein OQK32_04330 [Gammaproteobacteria bacterium]|nr:hypothetical protein [Gammaproteobacteria bacterium]MCW8924238.1 hypothetical protein [Gammaproteobacteria bacterium]
MLEYVLFHEKPFQLFVDWLKSKGISPETEIAEGTYEIKIPEDLDDELLDEIDDKYDALMDMNQQIVDDEEKENQQGYHMAGVVVTLKDGTISYADVDPDLLGRVMSAISPEEFGKIVAAIVDAVEKPQTETYCQRVRRDD